MNDYINIEYDNHTFGISREQFHEYCKANSEEIFDLFQDRIEEQFAQGMKEYFADDAQDEINIIAETRKEINNHRFKED